MSLDNETYDNAQRLVLKAYKLLESLPLPEFLADVDAVTVTQELEYLYMVGYIGTPTEVRARANEDLARLRHLVRMALVFRSCDLPEWAK